MEILRIEDGDIVADVGAGDGRWAVALAPVVGDSGRIYATEVDPNDLHGISKEMLVSETEQAGFDLVDEMKWANGDYAIVFQVAVPD